MNQNIDYQSFLHHKAQLGGMYGFKPIWLPDSLFDFQNHLCDWSIRLGRAAIFADCGLGKTLMQLVWAENVVRYTNQSVLIITPLAVSHQTVREAEKFGIKAVRSGDGKIPSSPCIVVTNYERLHHFTATDFAGCVCDESSILKNFEGATKAAITEFMRLMKFRLLCTATAAPNDYIELGTSSEALGGLGYMDMLNTYFVNPTKTSFAYRGAHKIVDVNKWVFKPHAEKQFWRFLCSWARACRKPSDLGYSDGQFTLPELNIEPHMVNVSRPMKGRLFVVPAKGLAEQRQERSHTVQERCEEVARLIEGKESSLAWGQLVNECDRMERLIPDAVQVSGRDKDEAKEEKFQAFESGQIRVLITKPQIAGFGLNWQHCNHMTFFPSHSFEQWYQAVRRCWRFGQRNPVKVDIVTTEGEADVMANLQRKADAAEVMFRMLVEEMNNSLSMKSNTNFPHAEKVPSWL